jgi:branched-chain amino acid transport system ATP-binding protein
MSEPVLQVHDLDVHRGEAHILHDVALSVAPRRVTALLGRNGVGKTTTLLSLVGLLPATGTMEFMGMDLMALQPHERIRAGIAYVPEDREVFTALSVEENLRLAMQWPESPARLELVHDLFPELRDRRAQLAGSLSGGQQQMVAIARALLHPADLLLIDEPTKGLAPIVITQVVEALAEVARDATILLVEQNLRVAEALATDAVVLDQGQVAWTGGMGELMADAELTRHLLGVGQRPGAVA